MNATAAIRQKISLVIISLLWLNYFLICARTFMVSSQNGWLIALASLVIVLPATFCWLKSRIGATTRTITSIAHAASVGVLVFLFSGTPLQIDMHMYFFANLAICAAWLDWRAIGAYTSFVAGHHLLLFFFFPLAVFPGNSEFTRVLLHAVILLLEAGILLILVQTLISNMLSAEKATNEAKEAHLKSEHLAKRAKEVDERMAKERQTLTEGAEAAAQQRLNEATAALASALRRLASGDLCFQMHEPLSVEFEALRFDLNSAIKQLRETLTAVAQTATTIDAGARDISANSTEHAERTERQIASLKDTAAALAQMTDSVQNSNLRVEEARIATSEPSKSAAQSMGILSLTIEAMEKIEQASSKVETIIEVIDEIAFQTNLLALNAGVEAARAGEAGKGFAVVAQEVRNLAFRSANASQEIRALISNSASEIRNGVQLVDETGHVLKFIEAKVSQIDKQMEAIALSSREQANGLENVNTAMTDMDQVTHQNVKMSTQTSVSAASVTSESAQLTQLINQFKLFERSSTTGIRSAA